MTTLGWKLNGELESEIPVRKFYFGESLIGKPFETFLDELDELSWIDLGWIELNWPWMNWAELKENSEKTGKNVIPPTLLFTYHYSTRLFYNSLMRGLYRFYSFFVPFFVRFSGFSASKTTVFSPRNKFFCQGPVIGDLRGLETNFVFSDPNIPYGRQFHSKKLLILELFINFFSIGPATFCMKILRKSVSHDH